MKTFGKKVLTGLVLGIGLINAAFGETSIIKDDFNVTSATTGFDLNNGVNFGINPPEATRLTGTAAEGVRYLQTVTTKPATNYSIATNALQIFANTNIGRFTLSQDGVSPFDFGPALGVTNATPENPLVYDVRVSMRNNATTAARFSFGISTEDGNVDALDFGIQLYRAASGNNFYTIAKRFDTNSTGMPDFVLGSPKIGTTATNTAGLTFVPFLIRVTDAGAETNSNYHSRLQVSINNGSTWIYDTATNTVELPNGWRFDAASRHFVFDQAGSAGDVFYDDFSVMLNPSRVKTWTGGVNGNWENAGNWAEAAAPTTGDALVFNGTSRQTNSNNRGPANLASVSSITFNNGGFVLQQNSLTVSHAITNLAGNNTINNGLTITNAVDIRTEAGALTLGGAVSGTGSITKTGPGQLILGGTNSYVGNTTVSAGTFLVNGSLATESAVSTVAGTTLGGLGTVIGTVTVGGTLAPGNNTAGVLTTGSHTWGTGVTYRWEIGNSGTDQIVASTLDIDASSVIIDITALETLTNWNNSAPASWTIVHTTGGISNFATNKFVLIDSFNALNPIGTGSFNVTSDGTDLVLNFVPGQAGIQNLGMQAAGLIQFNGSPNTSYKIEYTDSLNASITWSELTTLNSNSEGSVSYQDPQNPRPATRFYRILTP